MFSRRRVGGSAVADFAGELGRGTLDGPVTDAWEGGGRVMAACNKGAAMRTMGAPTINTHFLVGGQTR